MTYEDLSREELEEALREVEEELSRVEEERDEYEELAKKAKADLENYRKKQEERKQRWQDRAREELAADLIEVIDNLERAIAAADEETGVVQGVKMVADQLHETLEERGLERIDAEGEEFDPRMHNAVDTREHEEERMVLEQKKPGYVYKDRVLREAEVVVSEKKEE